MSFMNKERSWYKNRMVAVLAMMCGTLGAVPLIASAHHITGTVQADCTAHTVTVTVSAWAGDVEVVNLTTHKVTDVTPTLDANGDGSAVFQLADIGGNGDYTAGRKDFPTDPVPVPFTVACKGQPVIATTPSAGGPVGIAIHDVANVSGGNSPTGDVIFSLFDPSQATCAGPAVFTDTKTLASGTATSGDYTTAAVGTYRWTATYSGDANNLGATSGCQAEQVTTTKAQPAIATTQSAGGVVGVAIHDVANVTGGLNPTGTVTFNLYDPTQATCQGNPVFTAAPGLANGTATSGDYTTAAVGTYRWTATYSGDAMNAAAVSGCQAEQVTTTQALPAIATTPSAGGVVGVVIHDVANVSGGLNPTGMVTFNLYDPSQASCGETKVFTDTKPLVNGTATSGDYTTLAAGIYRWTATYSGDANNQGASSGCQDEQVTTTKAQPVVSTTPSDGGLVGIVTHDVAQVTGGQNPTGTVTFNLYDPSQATCQTPVFTDTQTLVNGQATSGDYTTVTAGTYRWMATYSGDVNNLSVTSLCGAELVTVTSPESGVQAAAVSLPDTGHSGLIQSLMLALLMVLIGIAVLLGQAYYRPSSRRIS
jgi:uncharacterized protein (DUF2141 family)